MLHFIGVLGAVLATNALPSPRVVGDWKIRVDPGTVRIGRARVVLKAPVELNVAPATEIHVQDERYESLPVFEEKRAGWSKGVRLQKLVTTETSAADMLLPESLVLKAGPGDAPRYKPGADYAFDGKWATVGRVADGGLPENKPVWMDYKAGLNRIDSILINARGEVSLRQGVPDAATPAPPAHNAGESVLANVWIPGRLEKLTEANLYPIIEARYPEPKHLVAPVLLPKTWAKLHNGEPLHILAWGDSVTDGGQASDTEHRYQNRFVAHLKERFPKANITLTTAAWGGRGSQNFMTEPHGSPYNFEDAVLKSHPDLITMEFVNDAYMTPEVLDEKYEIIRKRFQEIGAEWIVITPHYVRPDWMSAPSVRVETDPRPYVIGLRQFAEQNHIAVADTSLRWGHLVKEGIPYITLLSNCINHPNDHGHEMFALALMELFGGVASKAQK